MAVSLFSISIVGFLAGFLFSMPIAGPISILITTNALKGKLHYCYMAALGSSIADFVYVFIAIFGLTRFYSWYKPAIPYVMLAGCFFLIYIGFKVFKTKFDLEKVEDKSQRAEKIRKHTGGAFYAGFMINLLNPTLLINWLTSSFFIISFATSIGYDMGGLYGMIDKNVNAIGHIEGQEIHKKGTSSYFQFDSSKALDEELERQKADVKPPYFPLIASSAYALALAIGSIIWFFILAILLTRFRQIINVNIIQLVVKSLGVILCIMGIYFGYSAVSVLFKL
jgi:threonine/homoserine/homoserine lactone efflux protein